MSTKRDIISQAARIKQNTLTCTTDEGKQLPLDFHLPQFIPAMFTAETGFMVFFFVHYESIHRIGSPPTYRAQLRPWYSNLVEKDEMQVVDEEHFFQAESEHSHSPTFISRVGGRRLYANVVYACSQISFHSVLSYLHAYSSCTLKYSAWTYL